MRFLIEFDRKHRHLVTFKTFAGTQGRIADAERLDLELRRHAEGIRREIVILDAPSESAIRRTHGRYFEDLLAPKRPGMRVAEPSPDGPRNG